MSPKNQEQVKTSAYREAVELVVQDALEHGAFPDIFDESHIDETVEEVIALAHPSLETPRERRNAIRFAWYHLGRYAQESKII